MSLIDAMEALRGQPYSVVLDTLHQQTAPAVGKIRGDKIKLLQSFIGATQLRVRLANATPEQASAAASIAEAIQPAYLAAEDTFSINLADPQVATLLSAAHSAGLLSETEVAYLISLAVYDKPLWPDVTMRDVVAYFEPDLLDVGDWELIEPQEAKTLRLKLMTAPPVSTFISVQMRENDGEWSEWFHATTVHGIHALRSYTFEVPANGLARQFRWRGGEYAVNGIVSAA